MEVLRIFTAGSVDDGKSTLIGRLLFETNSFTTDQIQAIEQSSVRRGLQETDLSLFTDGLTAEREQGITIDVAHIYFNTEKRKFIIADTPGHVEYTRNMVTGASNAEIAILLIDARNGAVEQTKRHLYLTSMLGIRQVIFAVNKMDLVGWDENVFYGISSTLKKLAQSTGYNTENLHFIPVSAKKGDNITTKSPNSSWYEGRTVLEYLESLPAGFGSEQAARFAVQNVIRPRDAEFADYRGYAGKIRSGKFTLGQEVISLPSGQRNKISGIHRNGRELTEASAGNSVTILLEKEIDLNRGDLIVPAELVPESRKELKARICWLDHTGHRPGSRMLLQYGVTRVPAKITAVESILNAENLEWEGPQDLALNSIAQISLKTASPVFMDKFAENRANGAFILIDEGTHATVAVGFAD